MPRTTVAYDCVRCGACCCNLDQNREIGYRDYVEIGKRSPLVRQPELLKKYVVINEDGIPHMKLDARERCVALKGAVGRKVECVIYPDRPSGCRRVQPGDENCKKSRRERGIDPA